VKYNDQKSWAGELSKEKMPHNKYKHSGGSLRISLMRRLMGYTDANIRIFASGHPEKPSS
jgi:hypothetical protein